MGKLLACLLLVGLTACNVLGSTEPQKPAAVATATPDIQATIEAAERAAARNAVVQQLMATIQAPTHTGAPATEPDVRPFADPQPATLQRVVPQTPSLPENTPSGSLLPSAQSPESSARTPQLGATVSRSVDVVVGDVTGVRGESVSIDIVIDSQGQLVRGFQVNLTFDGTALPDAVGSAGSVSLPNDWILAANLAGPGDLRFLGVSSTGAGVILAGEVLNAQFDIPAEAAFGPITIAISLVDVSGADRAPLPVNVVNGRVVVVDSN